MTSGNSWPLGSRNCWTVVVPGTDAAALIVPSPVLLPPRLAGLLHQLARDADGTGVCGPCVGFAADPWRPYCGAFGLRRRSGSCGRG
ncbi:hypothetical protein ACFWBS_52205 [Streptomyces mirabilis]|uniref:hypothetical protein n=1 Tax=Streptomyces TaxID=1883 RepID=UPI000BE43FFA|nr:hypothetical protein [Streptomyces sp. OK228]